mmetsp:Transcript_48042/g.109119  ORF Transcript_48042/g.109119 Transcript_48042/m.109119 type:complete len:204 (+) Transcript_48042:94-705(+)
MVVVAGPESTTLPAPDLTSTRTAPPLLEACHPIKTEAPPFLAAQYGPSAQWADPVTGSSSMAMFGPKNRLTKSTASPSGGHDGSPAGLLGGAAVTMSPRESSCLMRARSGVIFAKASGATSTSRSIRFRPTQSTSASVRASAAAAAAAGLAFWADFSSLVGKLVVKLARGSATSVGGSAGKSMASQPGPAASSGRTIKTPLLV